MVGVELEAALSFSFHPGLRQAGRQEEEEEEIPHLAPRKLPLQVKPGFLGVSSSSSRPGFPFLSAFNLVLLTSWQMVSPAVAWEARDEEPRPVVGEMLSELSVCGLRGPDMLTGRTKVFSFSLPVGSLKVLWFKGNIAVITRAPLLGALQKERKELLFACWLRPHRVDADVVGPFGLWSRPACHHRDGRRQRASYFPPLLPASACLAGRHQHQADVAS